MALLRKLFLIQTLMCVITASAALPPPVLHCASVDEVGTVTLTWTIPADPLVEFDSYQIWTANSSAGPFVLLTNIMVYGQVTQQHVGALANNGARFYFMTTTTGGASPEVSLPSDTLATMFLQVFQSAPLGSADLSWNNLSPAPTADDTFTVWMEYPLGVWVEIAEVTANTFAYQHVVSVCEDSLTFRVELDDATGCSSFSNYAGDVFADVTPPSAPEIVSVSVDTLTNLATLDWEASPEADTDGYIIVFIAPGGAVIIDTVFGQNNTSYEWDESLADLRPEAYTVAAFDTCEVGTPPNPNTSATRPFHTSIHLTNTYDECAALVSLQWTPYGGWPVQAYKVYVQVDGGPWSLLANLDGTATGQIHQVAPFRTYCYAIEALEDGGTNSSLSNSSCVVTDYPGLPAFNYIRSVSVTGPEQITILDSVDVAAQVAGYRLERSDSGGEYTPIATRGPGPDPLLVFVDNDVDPSSVAYQYRVVVLDACGEEAVTSNIGANILLEAKADLNGFNLLEWNGYEDWAGTVQVYAIYRQIDDEDRSLLVIAPPDPWTYADNVSSFTGSNGKFCYQVTALETGNPSGINAVSESNEICTIQEDLVYIPNAFVRGGVNDVFIPVLSYVDVADYELSIINRWGQVIWTTREPEVPWDGTSLGSPVPLGVYAYYCRYENGAGRIFEKRGTVTMLTAWE